MEQDNHLLENMNEILAGRKVQAECIRAESHRHLVFYDLRLDSGTTVRRIENMARELALDLRSKTVPIVRLVPEQGVVRLQMAMGPAETVSFLDMPSEDNWAVRQDMILPLTIGETDEGKQLLIDLAKHPHTLIAGATGSGKSVLLHTIICALMLKDACGSRNIEAYLIDPKGTEFCAYDGYCTRPGNGNFAIVRYDYKGAIWILEHLNAQMEERYEEMRRIGVKSIEDDPELFPLVVCIIDELNDLMQQDKGKGMFQTLLVKLAQKSRACGIYLIAATQRPSVDVLTGVIKANFPARIACRVASQVDSRVILDANGAENLMGRGDAILNNMEVNSVRFQVAWSDPKSTMERMDRFSAYVQELKDNGCRGSQASKV